jgi:NAD(P)-dependent dehydrogenase (short-subunit alcohol dehydrogenase family)
METQMEYLKTLFNIENKIALLTGGAGILAGEIAKSLLAAGAQVILLDINQENLKRRVADLQSTYPKVFGIVGNVLDEDELKEIRKTILAKYDRIDILINTAGGNLDQATLEVDQNFFDLKIEQFKKVTDLNLNGTVLPTLIFGKIMADQQSGSIINISSMASFKAISRVVGYSAAKAAIDNFTRWLAVELAEKFGNSIRVNAIAPGFILTEQNRILLTNPDGSVTPRVKQIISLTPFRRFGNPDDLVGTVLWLASDASKFVTGTVIPVDGGFSISSGV